MSNNPPPYAGGSYTPPPPGPVASDESTWAIIAHVASLIGYFIGLIGQILIPLVILLTKGQTSAYVRDQAKEALNFQITMTIYAGIAFVLIMTLILMIVGIPMLIALLIFEIVVVIQAATAAGRGEYYRYPATIRFIK